MSAIGSSIVLFLGCSLVGWVLVGVALHTRQYQKKKELNEQSPATGTIVDSVKKVQTAGRGHPVTYYVPVVEFEANQHAYRLEYENGNRHKENIVIGQTVDLMYDPKDKGPALIFYKHHCWRTFKRLLYEQYRRLRKVVKNGV